MNSQKSRKTYSELRRLPTFKERFDYLSLKGLVGEDTFGSSRYLNQRFYRSREWEIARRNAIARDGGCDLGLPGHELESHILVHHINPICPQDFADGSDLLLDLNNLITVSFDTHNAIHYGDSNLLNQPYVERVPGDTTLW